MTGLTILDKATAATVQGALGDGCVLVLEGAGDWVQARNALLTQAPPGGGFALSITAGSAFGDALPRALVETLCHRWPYFEARSEDILFCLHEALANAILHGSLDVGMTPTGGPEQFSAFSAALTAALDDPARVGQHVGVCVDVSDRALTLSVRDSGKGYTPAQPSAQPSTGADDDKSGRGLMLIRDLADTVVVSDGGRRIVMGFIP